MLTHVKAKLLAVAIAVFAVAEQVSEGHFPQSKAEWFHFTGKLIVALAVKFAAATDGQK